MTVRATHIGWRPDTVHRKERGSPIFIFSKPKKKFPTVLLILHNTQDKRNPRPHQIDRINHKDTSD
jgi:hypothetical protein